MEVAAETITDESIASAAATLDASESSQGDASATSRDDPKNVNDMVATMNKHAEGTNVIKESIITFSNIDGSDKKGDAMIPASEPEKALELLKQLVAAAKDKASKKPRKKAKWDFRTCPHEQFGMTLDDTFRVFLLWSRTDEEKDKGGKSRKNEGSNRQTNVSKAFRRLEHYAAWMEDTGTDLTEPALTASSVQKALKVWAMRASVDKEGRFVWWIDMDAFDVETLKKELSVEDSLRACVWYSHYGEL